MASELLSRVAVRNESTQTWLQDLTNQINVGNHWLLTDGGLVIPDDGRERVPGKVLPGGEFAVSLTVQAPQTPGRYELALDLVQEGVTWFADRGSAARDDSRRS